MRRISIFLSLFLAIILFSTQLYGQAKLAQTGFQFLSVVPDARSAALGGAMTTVTNHSAALWSNPAMMAGMVKKIEVMANQTQWIADISHYSLSGAFRPFGGRYGIIGFTVMYVDYGAIEGTLLAENEQGYVETGDIKPFSYAVGIGYSKQLTDRFSVGGHIKLTGQDLGPAIRSIQTDPYQMEMDENQVSTPALDFGTQYRTGLKSLVFGMSVRNFSEEVRFASEGFQLPLTFNIGASFNMFDVVPAPSIGHKLYLSVDATHPRSYPEFIKVGTEYIYQELFALRLGYISNRDEERFSYGFGIRTFGLGIDYAYTPFGVFENVQRFSIKLAF